MQLAIPRARSFPVTGADAAKRFLARQLTVDLDLLANPAQHSYRRPLQSKGPCTVRVFEHVTEHEDSYLHEHYTMEGAG